MACFSKAHFYNLKLITVDNGAYVNAKDKYGLTPLHHTAIRGNESAMRSLLICDGIEKEPRDIQGSTPLHLTATYGQAVTARLLLLEGQANPRCVDREKRSPLHEACLEGNVEITKVLLEVSEKLFDFNFVRGMLKDRDEEGASPLLLAVGSGSEEIVQLLMKYNVNTNANNKQLMFPVHSAARTGDIKTLKLLIEVMKYCVHYNYILNH